MITDSIRGHEGLLDKWLVIKKLLIITFTKEKKKKEKGKGQHMDSCIYEPVLLYKSWLHKPVACWYIIIKIIIKKMHIVVIAVQNSQVNKKLES